jgi:hypothetical protein
MAKKTRAEPQPARAAGASAVRQPGAKKTGDEKQAGHVAGPQAALQPAKKSAFKKPLAAAVIAILVFAAFAFFAMSIPGNAVLVEGSLIRSATSAGPQEMSGKLGAENSFIISPSLHDPVQGVDSAMFNGAALFIQVLSGNKREVIQLLRVYDKGGLLAYCITNRGDVLNEERLALEQCNDFMKAGASVLVLIELPDTSKPQPEIVLDEKKITIIADRYGGIGSACFTMLKIMFPNAAEIIQRSNLITGAIKS